MLRKINETKTKSEQAYQAIKDSIIKNELLPGEEVTIGMLADLLGISPTPVREAVARLSSDGLINYTAHKQLMISGITEKDIHQIYEVRRLLEPYAACRVIDLIDQNPELEPHIGRVLKKAVSICETAWDELDYNDYLEIDGKLDEFFISAAGETLFREVYLIISARSKRVRTFAEAASATKPTKMMHTVTLEHVSILKAILEKDQELTQMHVLRHLKNGEERTIKAVREKLDARSTES